MEQGEGPLSYSRFYNSESDLYLEIRATKMYGKIEDGIDFIKIHTSDYRKTVFLW